MYAFNNTFREILLEGKSLEFNPSWKNGTGYFGGLIADQTIDLQVGEQAVFVDDYGRRAIVTNTRFGNVVLFERYAQKPEKEIVVVKNVPWEIENLFGPTLNGKLTEDAVASVLGYSGLYNIGLRIESLMSSTTKA